jgi:hypothetical protein
MASKTSFEDRAKRFISRTRGDHDHEQKIQFISEIFKIESQLIVLEKRLDNLSPGVWSSELSKINDELSALSSEFFDVQRVILSPGDHLHELIDIPRNEVSEKAVSEILTQLGWKWFPRELNRMYSVQERVYRKADAKSQQMLTNRIILLFSLAVIISASTFAIQYI